MMQPIIPCLVCASDTQNYLHGLYDDRHGLAGRFAIRVCGVCGFMMTVPRLVSGELPELYRQHYTHIRTTPDKVRQEAQELIRNRFRRTIDALQWVMPGDSILDVGCGKCVHAIAMEELGAQVYGLDADPGAGVLGDSLGLSVHTGQLADKPFPNLEFDWITAFQVIEHVPDPQGFLLDIRQRLKSGGHVFLTLPSADSMFLRIFRRRWIHWHVPYHQNFFSLRSLDLLCGKCGFRIVKTRNYTPSMWMRLQIRCLLQRLQEGEINPIWQSTLPGDVSDTALNCRPPRMISSVRAASRSLAWMSVDACLAPIARLADAIGKGDAHSVVLEVTA